MIKIKEKKQDKIESICPRCLGLDDESCDCEVCNGNGFILEQREQLKECPTCGKLKVSSPTPDGDEICPYCGDREMMDYEGEDIKRGLK